MTIPAGGEYYYSPAFAVVQTAPLAAPAPPTVTLMSAGGGSFAIKPTYTIVAFLDGGRNFHSVRASGAWSGASSTSPDKIAIQFAPVPRAKAYGVWRTFTDQASAVSSKLIYFGSGRNIFSGKPETTSGSTMFWGRDFFLWDFVGNAACVDGTKATGRDVALPTDSATARGEFILIDCRAFRSGTLASSFPVTNAKERSYQNISDSLQENENDALVGFSRGMRLRVPVRFTYLPNSDAAKAVNLIWNSELARADSDSSTSPVAGLRLMMSLAYSGTNPYSQDEWAPATEWFPVRISDPRERQFVPIVDEALVLFEETFIFEAEDSTLTIPDSDGFDIGRPLV